MKAMVLHGVNNFSLEDVQLPKIGNNEVLLKVQAAGICGSDIPRMYQTGAYSYPLIPGHEFSGIVVEKGENVKDEWIGKRVGVFPLISCKSCLPCKKHQYEMCRNYSYLGSRRDGGFAEYVAVPSGNLLQIPDTVTFEQAAMMEPMAVAVHAMRRVSPGRETIVIICGFGTIGVLLWMFLREAGVRHLLVIGNKEFQKQLLLKLGGDKDSFCNSKEEEVERWICDRTGNAGAGVFFECVGNNETFIQAIENTAPGGKICLVGNPDSDRTLPKRSYWKILRNQLTIIGTWNSSFWGNDEDDWHYVLSKIVEDKIQPTQLITHRFPLENLEQGFHIMRDKTEGYVKIMGIMGGRYTVL